MIPSHPNRSRRRNMGAVVAILAGSSAALRGVSSHLDHPTVQTYVQTLWHRVFDIGSAVLIVAAIVLLVFLGVRRWRS